MKRMVAALMFLTGSTLFADDNAGATPPKPPVHFDYQLPDSIEMPGGEIYNHPKVVDVKPNGITIMHDNGAAFWPFSQLPDAVRDQFHYNPAAAQQYTDELLLRRQKIDEQKAKKAILDADHQVYLDLVSQRYTCTYLKMRIDATKRQINSDTNKLSRIDSDIQQDRKIVSESAETPSSSSSSSNGSNGFWNTTNSNSDDNSDRAHVVGEFDTDWQDNKTDYEMWTSAKENTTNNLAEYQQEYQEAQDKLKQLEAQWAQVQQKEKQDNGKLDRQIHQSVQQEVQDSMAELKKLRDMRNQQLITTDEYIKAKAKILKRF